ncbi:MAG: hypothetical protein ACLFQP_05425 [Halothece sp.]
MVLQIICFCFTWGFIIFCLWNGWRVTKRGTNYLKTLHQVPCSRCAFFTNDHRLKCTVNPYEAGTEEAINCRDFEPKGESDGCSCHNQSNQKKARSFAYSSKVLFRNQDL